MGLLVEPRFFVFRHNQTTCALVGALTLKARYPIVPSMSFINIAEENIVSATTWSFVCSHRFSVQGTRHLMCWTQFENGASQTCDSQFPRQSENFHTKEKQRCVEFLRLVSPGRNWCWGHASCRCVARTPKSRTFCWTSAASKILVKILHQTGNDPFRPINELAGRRVVRISSWAETRRRYSIQNYDSAAAVSHCPASMGSWSSVWRNSTTSGYSMRIASWFLSRHLVSSGMTHVGTYSTTPLNLPTVSTLLLVNKYCSSLWGKIPRNQWDHRFPRMESPCAQLMPQEAATWLLCSTASTRKDWNCAHQWSSKQRSINRVPGSHRIHCWYYRVKCLCSIGTGLLVIWGNVLWRLKLSDSLGGCVEVSDLPNCSPQQTVKPTACRNRLDKLILWRLKRTAQWRLIFRRNPATFAAEVFLCCVLRKSFFFFFPHVNIKAPKGLWNRVLRTITQPPHLWGFETAQMRPKFPGHSSKPGSLKNCLFSGRSCLLAQLRSELSVR